MFLKLVFKMKAMILYNSSYSQMHSYYALVRALVTEPLCNYIICINHLCDTSKRRVWHNGISVS